MKMRMTAILACLLLLLAAAPVRAEPIEVGAGQTRAVRLDRAASHVIIGNPEVADISVDAPSVIIVFGRRSGATTLTVLDGAKRVMLEEQVVVRAGGPATVTVTYGAGKDVPPGGASVVHACASGCSRAVDAPAAKASGGAGQ